MPDETPPNPNGVEVKTPDPNTPSWYIDEGIPGVGNRPAWLPEKYKSAAEVAKAYTELQKKFGEAPAEYDLSKSKFIEPDNAHLQEMAKYAREKRVPADVIDKVLATYDKYYEENSINYDEEAKKLGDNAKERVTVLDNWAKANLSEEAYKGLTAALKSADSVKALEELRGKMMSSTTMVPNGNDDGKNTEATLDTLKAELQDPANLKKYKEDVKYRKDYSARLELAAKNSGYVDKQGA
jgi:hypothetical protein